MGKVGIRNTAEAKKSSLPTSSKVANVKRKTQEDNILRLVEAARRRKRLLENVFVIKGTQIQLNALATATIRHERLLIPRLKRLANPFGNNGQPFERQHHLFFEFEKNRNNLMLRLMRREEKQRVEKAQANLAAKMRY